MRESNFKIGDKVKVCAGPDIADDLGLDPYNVYEIAMISFDHAYHQYYIKLKTIHGLLFPAVMFGRFETEADVVAYILALDKP